MPSFRQLFLMYSDDHIGPCEFASNAPPAVATLFLLVLLSTAVRTRPNSLDQQHHDSSNPVRPASQTGCSGVLRARGAQSGGFPASTGPIPNQRPPGPGCFSYERRRRLCCRDFRFGLRGLASVSRCRAAASAPPRRSAGPGSGSGGARSAPAADVPPRSPRRYRGPGRPAAAGGSGTGR
jgi:hypothetical protein